MGTLRCPRYIDIPSNARICNCDGDIAFEAVLATDHGLLLSREGCDSSPAGSITGSAGSDDCRGDVLRYIVANGTLSSLYRCG